jgi:WD40 repeat protein/serine/threonine protein kinase
MNADPGEAMPVDANKVKVVFLAAIEKAAPGERAAYLDEACAGDTVLRQRLEALLQVHDRPDHLLDQPAAQHLAADSGTTPLDFLEPSEKPGTLGRLGHYEVLEVVGQGGMGVVLRAFDAKLHRVVAIKALAPALAASGSSRQRFVREAQATAAVTHDNVIAIHAVENAGPVPYLVTQFIDGCTLQQKLDRTGPLPLKEILRLSMQIADGLAAAHRHGLVHRDVKPANILLENGVERVKITDFGLARAVDDASLTQSGVIAGTPAYMSPEQANGEPVDHRSDLFSLGSVLYALCTGHPPFRASTTVAVLKRVCDETPRPIREINADVPEWLVAVVAKLHAKDPGQRFESAAAVAVLLRRRLTQLQTGSDFTELESPVAKPSGSRPQPGKRFLTARRLAVAAVLLGVIFAGWFTRNRWLTPPTPAPPDRGPVAAQPQPWKPQPPLSAEELAKLPSPLDGRKREDIPGALLTLAGGGDPEKAPAELVAVLGEQADVCSVAISPDGRFVASGGNDWKVRLWNLGGWEPGITTPPCRLLKGHAHSVWSVVFSPDGRLLASGSLDGTIMLWDVHTGKNTLTLAGHSRWHSLLAFSPDGRTIAAGGDDGTINRWDLATGQRREPLRFHRGIVRAVACSPDGRLLASAGEDQTVQIIEVATGRSLRVFRGDTKYTDVAFSPDGKLVAATCDAVGPSVRTWEVESGQEQPSLRGHTTHVSDLAFHPLGRLLATGSWDGTARVWDRTAGTSRVLHFGAGMGAATRVAVAWSPEGRYLAAARENRIVCLFRIPAPPP